MQLEDLSSLKALKEQMVRLEADISRRTVNGGDESELSDLRWRQNRLRNRIDAEAARPQRNR